MLSMIFNVAVGPAAGAVGLIFRVFSLAFL